MTLYQKMYARVREIIDSWQEPDIYAVSFFVYANASYEYRGMEGVSLFAVSCNTESECPGAGRYDEERWNYAFWAQDEQFVIDPDHPDELLDELLTRCCVANEPSKAEWSEVFHAKLQKLAAKIGRRLQQEGVLKKRFGHPVSIIVHGLEYTEEDLEATKLANPHGEAEDCLRAMWGEIPASDPQKMPEINREGKTAAELFAEAVANRKNKKPIPEEEMDDFDRMLRDLVKELGGKD